MSDRTEEAGRRDAAEAAGMPTQRGQSRRTFLRRAAGAVPGAAVAGSLGLGGCAPEGGVRERGGEVGGGSGGVRRGADGADADGVRWDGALQEAPLRALAEVALPTDALGAEGAETAVAGFMAWVEGFEPAAELDHPYLTGELRYGEPHPGPRWAAQLQAMELESRRRSGASLAERSEDERRAMVSDAIRVEGSASPPGDPARAGHVVVGLLAWFYGTSEANDLCYRARVGRHTCRGIASLPEEPAPLPADQPAPLPDRPAPLPEDAPAPEGI